MKWYLYDIRNFSDAEYDKWYGLMDRKKQQRVDRFHFSEDKKRTVAGEMLARQAIAQWCNVPEESIVFGIGDHGKPFATDLSVEFNISHSGNMVACAVADAPIGIDIEQIRPVRLSTAKRIFTPEELRSLFGYAPTAADFEKIPDDGMLLRFFELWTAKEAYGKCVGTGLIDCKDTSAPATHVFREGEYVISVYVGE